jgi:hypothetical protein
MKHLRAAYVAAANSAANLAPALFIVNDKSGMNRGLQ